MTHSKKNNRFDTIKSILKNTIITTSVLLISIATISGSINANARQQEILNQELFNNPQAILNVTFKDNVYLDNIIDNELNSDKNWQGLKFDNNYGITSLSGLSNIGGVEEMVTINGQYSNRTVKRAYKNKLQELITKIDDIKNNNQSFQGEAGTTVTEGVKDSINKELSKMNSWELKKQRYFNWSQSKVLSLSLVGNTETLNTIKSILDKSGHVKNLMYNNMEDLFILIEDLRSQTQGKSDTEINIAVEKISRQSLEKSGLNGDLQESINNEYKNAPDYYKNPISSILLEDNMDSADSKQNIISSLLNGITAKAESRYDVNMKSVWCGWAPCGVKMFLGANHQNALAFTIGMGTTSTMVIKGTTWIYSWFNKLTYLCGPAIIQCNIGLLGASYAIVLYLSTLKSSFESICEYARWNTGVEYEISFAKGLRIAKCSKGI